MVAAAESSIVRPEEVISPGQLHMNIIADYGGRHRPDLAFSEVEAHLRMADENSLISSITPNPVYKFSTTETGFKIAQMGLYNAYRGLVIFSNTAPRGNDVIWQGEVGQPFVYGMLDNGVPVFAVHAGYNLSFIKNSLTSLRRVNVTNNGTQFRSRDQYAGAAMAILQGDESLIGDELDLNNIPEPPRNKVASIDGYGNMKTTITVNDLPDAVRYSAIVRVNLNGRSHFAINTVSGVVEPKEGDLCMNQGSSGDKDNPYIEFVVLGDHGKASKRFRVKGSKDNLGAISLDSITGIN